mmetsp:Transcript_39497/g.57679  ORF Transcript_39497/g.57679 Transcript_39497/m.57679 type:complete len:685 (-) Transcript_39497:219-2273(-)
MSFSPYDDASDILNQILQQSDGKTTANGYGLKSTAYAFFAKQQKKNKNKKNRKVSDQRNRFTYALVCQTMKYKSLLDAILSYSSSPNEKDGIAATLEQKIKYKDMRNKGLCFIMLYELLLSKNKSIRGGGYMKRTIVKLEDELLRVKKIVMKQQKQNEIRQDIPVFPRYVRINTLKCTVDEVLKVLHSDLSKLDGNDRNDKNDVDEQQSSTTSVSVIYADKHVPNLLVLHPKTGRVLNNQHPLVKDGKIVLQDKSSCFSALALVHGDGRFCGKNDENSNKEEEGQGDYIDACAAPGNKTTHLASLLAELPSTSSKSAENSKNNKKKKGRGKQNDATNKITVYACDRSSKRIEILDKRLSTIIPEDYNNELNVKVQSLHQDFLKIDPLDYPNVKCILLDPSCSGSGIINAPDRHYHLNQSNDDDKREKEEKERIESLSNFQLLALRHAMSFPNVTKIIYSTCSIHQREDEDVVHAALCEHNEQAETTDQKWKVVLPKCLQHWTRRGHSSSTENGKDDNDGVGLTDEQANCLIRCNGSDGDETNGFFVSYFERESSSNSNEVMSKNISDEDDGCQWPNWPPKGTKTYNGEFANIVADDDNIDDGDDEGDDAINCDDKEEMTIEKVAPTENKTKKTKATTSATEESAKISAKKRNKKLAWKKRQMEQKAKRLEKKKREIQSSDEAKE